MDLKTRTGLWMARAISLIFAVLEARGCYIHFTHEDWPHHAQFHSLTGLGYYLGLTLAFWAITAQPFRDRQPWARWAIPAMGFFVHGLQVVTDAFTDGLRGGGTSQGAGMMFYFLAWLAFILYLVAAALTWNHFRVKPT